MASPVNVNAGPSSRITTSNNHKPTSNAPGHASAPAPAPAPPHSHSHSHSHTLSLSPRSNPSDVDADYYSSSYYKDDVLSNSDVADLEEYRSDGTGATSPAPASPGPGSPTSRIHPLTAGAQQAVQLHHDNMLKALASANAKQASKQHQQQQQSSTTQPSPTDRGNVAQSSPATATKSTDELSTNSTAAKTIRAPKPAFAAGSFPAPSPQPARSGLSSPVSLYPSAAGVANLLPSAHGLPSDPKEAATLSKLFAVPPAQSPGDEFGGFGWGAAAASAPGSGPSVSAAVGGDRRVSSTLSALVASARSRPSSRPHSPDRTRDASLPGSARTHPHGTPSSTSAVLRPAAGAAPDIFERDIEHRDAAHVMSKQEALDVAIPSVLDDAVEAITDSDVQDFDIVAPHASATPLALNAQALSAHSLTTSPVPRSPASGVLAAGGPTTSAPHSEAPPGSLAAQIAERFTPSASRLASEDGSQSPISPVGASGSGAASAKVGAHRRPLSDGSVVSGSGSSLRSRSPPALKASVAGPGVQQVLEPVASASHPTTHATPVRKRASLSPASGSAVASPLRETLPSSHLLLSPSTSATPASVGPGMGAVSSSQGPSLATAAAAVPSLPLPNPFRSASPAVTNVALPGVAGAPGMESLPSSSMLSMDGAVIPSSDVATLGGSLDGLADAVVRGGPEADDAAAAAAAASASPYSSRSPMHFSPAPGSPVMERGKARGRPLPSGGYEAPPMASQPSSSASMPGGGAENDATIRQRTAALLVGGGAGGGVAGGARTPSTTASAERKRLSFFSYADIINQTPAELLDFGTAVERAAEADEEKHHHGGHGGGGGGGGGAGGGGHVGLGLGTTTTNSAAAAGTGMGHVASSSSWLPSSLASSSSSSSSSGAASSPMGRSQSSSAAQSPTKVAGGGGGGGGGSLLGALAASASPSSGRPDRRGADESATTTTTTTTTTSPTVARQLEALHLDQASRRGG